MSDSYEFLKAHFDRIQAEDIAARVQLYADHSAAMDFVRELASLPCSYVCGNCLICRARRWLHAEAPPAVAADACVGYDGPCPKCRDLPPTLAEIQRRLGIGAAAAMRVQAALSTDPNGTQGFDAVPASTDDK